MPCTLYVPGKGVEGAVEEVDCGDSELVVPAPQNLFDASSRPWSLECTVARLEGQAPPPAATIRINVGAGSLPAYVRVGELLARERVRNLQRLLDGCGKPVPLVYIDNGLTRAEILYLYRKLDMFPIQLLERLNLLTPCTVIVNPFWLTSWEMEILSEAGSPVALSVSDSLAAGSTPLLHEMAKYRVVFSIATGWAGQTVIDEIRLAALLLKGFHDIEDSEPVLAQTFQLRLLEGPKGYLVVEASRAPWETITRLGSMAVKRLVCSTSTSSHHAR